MFKFKYNYINEKEVRSLLRLTFLKIKFKSTYYKEFSRNHFLEE